MSVSDPDDTIPCPPPSAPVEDDTMPVWRFSDSAVDFKLIPNVFDLEAFVEDDEP
jgi:hypothetical protein